MRPTSPVPSTWAAHLVQYPHNADNDQQKANEQKEQEQGRDI